MTQNKINQENNAQNTPMSHVTQSTGRTPNTRMNEPEKHTKNILIIAAENSAENYGAQILQLFKQTHENVRFFGVGGDKLLAAGAELLVHNKELSVVGIIEVISSIVKLKKIMNLLVNTAIKRNADAVILIDYPDFNIRIAKKFKKAGIPVYYYISPTVWAWRYSRVNLLKAYVTHMFIIFPFEIPIYEKENIPFTYTGHPLVPMIRVTETKESVRSRLAVTDGQLMVTLLPGSRKSEVHFLMPEMLKAMHLLKKEFNIKLFLQKAAGIDDHIIDDYIAQSGLPVTVLPQADGYNLIGASDIVLTTCGTSNLEIAIIGTPFVSVYRVNKLSYFLGKRFVKINRYSIVNILSGEEVIKELIQEDFTAANILAEMKRILTNPEVRETMLEQFHHLRTTLAQDKRAPEIILRKIAGDLNL